MIKKLSGFYGMIRQEWLRLVTDWRLYTCIGVYVLVCYVAGGQFHSSGMTPTLEQIFGLSNINKLMVLVATMPMACTFCDDWLGNYTKPAVSRGGISAYIYAKIIVCVLTALLVSFVSLLLFAGIETIRTGTGYHAFNFEGYPFYDLLGGRTPMLYTLVVCYLFSIIVAVYAAYGLVISCILPNRFVAVMAPFFSAFILEELTEDFFPSYMHLHSLANGRELLRGHPWISVLLTTAVALGFIVVAAALVYRYITRRIRNEIV